jgi:membrane associated rhomboid family serine protease
MRYNSDFRRRPAWGSFFANSIVNKIIVANVIVYLLQVIFRPQFTNFLALTPRDVVHDFYFWQLLTYMFLHGGFFHLFFNMLITWFFGSTLESVWGSQKFLKYYLTCGLGGGIFFMIFNFNGMVVGASAAVFGLYLAYAMLFPNNRVYIYFLFPVKAKYFVAFIALFQLAYGISGPSGVAYFAHLGGMVAGLFFFRRELESAKFWRGASILSGSYKRPRREGSEEQDIAKIDSILDKIASKGYENLSSTEKRILENYSRKHKEDSE